MGGGSNTLLKGGERGFVCVVAVSSAAAGCGYCSEPSLDQNKGCCSHTAGVWLLADPGRSTALCPGQARWRMELGGPAGKKKNTSFFCIKRVLLLHLSLLQFPLEVCWILCSASAAKKIKLKIELYVSLPVRKFLGKPERRQSSCRHWNFGLHVEIK